jgi:hypothetical protein
MFKFIVSLCLACAPALVIAQAEKPLPDLTASEAAAVKAVGDRGLALYNYDQAAWHGTDAMLKDVKDPAAKGIKGWVVTPVAQGWQIVFYTDNKGTYDGAWSAIWTGTKIVEPRILEGAERTLSAEQIRLIEAKKAVPLKNLQSCSDKPFNSVVIPGATAQDPISVYLMTPQTDANIIPMGGHNRVDIKDGKVVSQRQFTKGCFPMERPDGKKDNMPAALMMTHLLDPTPTEIHVFAVYTARLPLYVSTVTSNIVWEIGIKDGKPQILIIRRM